MRKLTADKRVALIIAIVVLAVTLSAVFIPTEYIRWGAAVILIIAAISATVFIKKRCILSINGKQVLLIISVISVLYLFFYYFSGLYFGYASTGRTFSARLLFGTVVPIVLITVCCEIFRLIMLSQSIKALHVLSFITGVCSEVLISGGVLGFTSTYALMDFVGLSLFPAITANILYNYISPRYGIASIIVYRLSLSLPKYIIPIEPNISPALPSLALLVLPLLTLAFIKLLFEKRRKMATVKKSKLRFVFPCVMLAAAVALIMLISCQFRYAILVVGSPSMSDEINKGDAVVYEEYEAGDAEVGDVIVFTKGSSSTRVIHRVVEIIPLDGKNTYITKGDANKNPDAGYITDESIIGVVKFKVAYIGYPTIWLHDIFENKN